MTTETDGVVTGGGAEIFATEDIAVTGTVFALATPTVNTPIDLGTRDISVTANAFRLANPDPAATVINAGEFHFGDSIDAALSITNDVPADGFSESLDAAFTGTNTGDVSGAAGSIDNLGPGATDNTSLVISVDSSSAGGFTEGLNIGTLESVGPAIINSLLDATPIAQGATQNAIEVSIDSSVAGSIATSIDVQFQADGTGTSGLANEDVGGVVSFNVLGAGFNLAEGDAAPTELNFAAKRVGDATESQSVTVSNIAPVSAFTETLTADIGAAPSNYDTSTNQLSSIAGGGNDSFDVTLNTNLSGDFDGQTLQVDFTSNEVLASGLGDTDVGDQQIILNGKVYQTAVLDQLTNTIDFGIVHVGDAVTAQGVGIENDAAGALNDVITGTFDSVDGPFQGNGDLGPPLLLAPTASP